MYARRNAIVALDDPALDGYHPVEVRASEVRALREMVRRDSCTVAALKVITNSIQMSTLELDGVFLGAPAAFKKHVMPYWVEFARVALVEWLLQAGCVFTVASVAVDCADDAFFVAKHGEARRRLAERGAIAADKVYENVFPVPIAAAPGTYRLYAYADEMHRCRLLALPAPATTPSASRKVAPLQVVTGASWELPDVTDGAVHSCMASLLSDFVALELHRLFGLRSANTMSHPPVVAQLRPRPDRKVTDAIVNEEFADGAITGVLQPEKRRRRVGAEIEMQQAQKRFAAAHAQLRTAQEERVGGGGLSSTDLLDVAQRVLRHPVEDAVMLMGAETEIAHHVPQAAASPFLPFLVQNRAAEVARVMGVPQAMIAPQGGGAGAGSTATNTATPEDRATFSRTVQEVYAGLMDRLRDVYCLVYEDHAERHELEFDRHGIRPVFSARTQIVTDAEELWLLFEAGGISRKDALVEARRLAGLDHLPMPPLPREEGFPRFAFGRDDRPKRKPR